MYPGPDTAPASLLWTCDVVVEQDNLTATSSPIQRVLRDPRPGEQAEVIETNHSAWCSQCGPTLERMLGEGPWMGGDTFTALDVMVRAHGVRECVQPYLAQS